MASIVDPPPDGNTDTAPDWDSWREALAIALQGQYGTAKTWATVSEQARDGWRADAANIMASIPNPPIVVDRCPLCRSAAGHWHGCGYGLPGGFHG